jgi:hypothetical protein
MIIYDLDTAPAMPGIYRGLSNEAYHAGPGVSKSQLDHLARSPYHYWFNVLTGQGKRTETPAMAFGTNVHTAILEPKLFANYVVMPKVDGRTKEGKLAKETAEALAAERGTRIISADDYQAIMQVQGSFQEHPVAQALTVGEPELSIYWSDPDTDVLCRCRPDWLGEGCIIDLKTTEDASPDAFTRSAYKWRYFVQAAFYLDGCRANDIELDDFFFAAIEKAPPNIVMAYEATDELIAAGRLEYKRLLRRLVECQNAHSWPGYADNEPVLPLYLPRYARELVTNVDDDDIFDDNAIASFNELV